MNILEEIRRTIAQYDTDLIKNEEEEEYIPNMDSYQKAIDSAVEEPENLNFSMDLFDDEDEEVEILEIPQSDAKEDPIKNGDRVLKINRPKIIGTVIAIGELVEVEWNEDLTTLEYPEELIHAEEEEEEMDKVTSLFTEEPKVIDSGI